MAEVNFSILTDLIDSLVTLMPSLVDLIVAVVPVVIIGAFVGALVVFIQNILTKIHF
jgi:type III secretory pathway component EscS